jgi:hypothetical protein
MKTMLSTLFALLFVLPLSAQKNKTEVSATIDSVYLSGLTWRNIGPFRGGRSCAVTGVPNKPNLYYFGSTGGWNMENYRRRQYMGKHFGWIFWRKHWRNCR